MQNRGRRTFIKSVSAGLLGLPALANATIIKPGTGSLFLAACDDKRGRHYVSGFDTEGRPVFRIGVAARLHSLAVHPAQQGVAVAFSRRAGRLAYVFDYLNGQELKVIETTPGRHFYGHGAFTGDGRYLFTSENDFENGQGVIGIRDARSWERLGEVPSHGVGPHEIRMLSDGKTLVVANGGIQTHPDFGRRKLNLDSMKPSLAYIDTVSGKLLEQHYLANHQLSIRHLSLADDNGVAFGLQYQGSKTDRVPLVGFHRRGGEVRLLAAPEPVRRHMNQYVASVCVDSVNGVVGVTCPRGDMVTFWDIRRLRHLKTVKLRDAAGIALTGDRRRYVVTNGFGEILQIDAATLAPGARPQQVADTRWDNHLVSSI